MRKYRRFLQNVVQFMVKRGKLQDLLITASIQMQSVSTQLALLKLDKVAYDRFVCVSDSG